MSQLDTVARPYARAIYQQAKASQTQKEWKQFLDLGAQMLVERSVEDALASSSVASQMQDLFEQCMQKAYNRTLTQDEKNCLSLLQARGRMLALPNIAKMYQEILDKEAGVCAVVVESAKALTNDELSKLEVLLAKKIGRSVSLTMLEKPELLAGIKIEYDGCVIDQTLKGKMAQFAQTLTD